MNNSEKQLNKIKEEYMSHTMSEKGVKKMKENIEKAKRENHHARRNKILRNSLAAVAAVFVIITVLPNTSANAAYAMSRIPIVSKWVEVVTFRNYQYDTERNTADITVPEIVPQISAEENSENEASDASPNLPENENKDNTQAAIQKTADEINAEIQEITDKLIQEFEENLKYQEGYQEMMVTSEIIATTEQYFTLKLICYQGAGSGAEWDYFYTIDLESGSRIQLSDLFNDGSDYINIISENIKTQMKEQMAADENVIYWLDSDIPEWNFDKITDETGFYLNQDGNVVICFNEGDVAPMYMGCVEFIIPGEVTADIMHD